ncbi:MAG: hypothetical protein QXX55_01745 [Candidatus Pacearchaeota archaeon]
MPDENLIYIKFRREESINTKKDFLIAQINLLKIAGAINKYNFYRTKEYELKSGIIKKIRYINSSINKLQKILPKPKKLEILEKTKEGEQEQKTKIKKTGFYEKSIDEQLKEIEEKLNQIQNKDF